MIGRRLMIEVPFVLFAVLMPFVAQGPTVEVAGFDLSVEGLWGAWNILIKGDARSARHGGADRDDIDARPAGRHGRAARPPGVHGHRRVHGPLRRRRHRRHAAHAHRPHRRAATTHAGCGRPGPWPARPAPCSSAATSGASACTRRCSPAATTARSRSTPSDVARQWATGLPAARAAAGGGRLGGVEPVDR